MEIRSAPTTQYIGQKVVHLDVRPKRAVFLFRTNSKTQFRDAVERACSRWGGIQEPIIPVSARGRIQPNWRQIVELLDPDIAFDAAALDPAAHETVEKQLGLPLLPVRMEDRPSSGAHPLVVEQREEVAYASLSTSPSAVAGPGLLPRWDSAERWAQGGLTVLPSKDPVALAVNQLQGTTLIEATGAQCGDLSGTYRVSGLLWVARPSSLKDAVWFWNIRALMPRSISRAKAALISPEVVTADSLRQAVQQFKQPRKWSTPDVLLLSLSIDRERLAAIGETMGFEVLETGPLSFHLGRERDPTEPLTALVNADPRSFLLHERQRGLRTTSLATVEAPKTVLRLTSPARFGLDDGGGTVRTRLSGPLLSLPHRKAVALLFLSDSEWKDGGLEIENDVLPEYYFELSVPSGDEVLRAAVSGAGLSFEASRPGLLAEAVRARLQPEERLFADPKMRDVVNALTTPRSKGLAREIKAALKAGSQGAAMEIADRIGSRMRRVARALNGIASGAGVRVPEVADRMERLVRLDLAERGFLVTCEQCTLDTFVPLRAATSVGTCPACGSNVGYATNQNGELQVHYRLNALLDRASDQGVIPHLAVLDQLAPDPQRSHFLLGAHLSAGNRVLGEVDLLGFDAETLLCGEVKTSAGRLTSREVKKTVGLAGRMKADVVVFGCTEEVPQQLVDIIFILAKSHGLAARVVDPRGVQTTPRPERSVADPLPLSN